MEKKKQVWNKGLTKYTDSRVAKLGKDSGRSRLGKSTYRKNKTYEEEYGIEKARELKRKLSNKHKGIRVWNKDLKGVQKYKNKNKKYEEIYGIEKSEKIKEKMRQAKLGIKLSENHRNNIKKSHRTKESREKSSKSLTGRKLSEQHKNNIKKYQDLKSTREFQRNLKIGKKQSIETIEKRKETMKKTGIMKIIRAKQIFPKKDTKIEVKIQNFLEKLDIDYFKHKYMNINHAYQCDLFIPSMNLVIECDGDYWHKYPTGRDIDHIRTSELLEKGFKVLRIWENEIKQMSIDDLKNKLNYN